jgi:hypothetical protein
MMNNAIEQAAAVADTKLEELVARASTENVKVKLRNLADTCRHLVITAKQRLTVPLLLQAYAAKHVADDQALAESSIRNKRKGGNPYQELYRAWETVAEIVQAQPSRALKVASSEIIAVGDLAGIADLTLRHQVRLLIEQNRSYKNQLDILKQVRDKPVISLGATHPDSAVKAVLDRSQSSPTESEREAVAEFLSPRSLKQRGLVAGEAGVLQSRDGKDLSDPGFLDALRKVVELSA